MLSPQWLSSKKRPSFSLPPAPVGVVTFLFNNDEMKFLLQINYFIKGSNVQESSDYKSKLISQNSQEQKDNQTRLSLESACFQILGTHEDCHKRDLLASFQTASLQMSSFLFPTVRQLPSPSFYLFLLILECPKLLFTVALL